MCTAQNFNQTISFQDQIHQSTNFSFLSDGVIRLLARRVELKYPAGGLDSWGLKYGRKEEAGGE